MRLGRQKKVFFARSVAAAGGGGRARGEEEEDRETQNFCGGVAVVAGKWPGWGGWVYCI